MVKVVFFEDRCPKRYSLGNRREYSLCPKKSDALRFFRQISEEEKKSDALRFFRQISEEEKYP
jgi:hypothetical protein